MEHRSEFLIDAGEPVFAGHFPGRPLLPGVLLLALARRTLAQGEGRAFHLAAVERQKFIRPVLPGERVTVECRVKGRDSNRYTVAVRVLLAGGQPAAKADLILEAE